MLFLSWRQLMAKKKQSLLILLGISFGTMLYISISGIQLGFREYISEQLLNNTAHILISGRENNINASDVTQQFYGSQYVRWIISPAGKRNESKLENYYGWQERLLNHPDVFDFSPRLSINALISNGKFTTSAKLTGSLPEKQVRVSSVNKYMRQGQFEDLKGGANKIIIGSGIAKNLGVAVNNYVQVRSTNKNIEPFKIVGIIHFGNEELDKNVAFAHLNRVQVLNQTPGRVTDIAVALNDIRQSTELANFWQTFSRDKVQSWQEANKLFMEMIRIQDFVRYFITFAVLIVAAFGIYNVLTIMINQKKREIAILRAIGYNPARILNLILYQGSILGFAGGLLGLLFGYLICLIIGSIDLGIDVGGSSNLLVSYDLDIYIVAFVSANIASIIASLLPAYAASHMTPMDIIRSDS